MSSEPAQPSTSRLPEAIQDSREEQPVQSSGSRQSNAGQSPKPRLRLELRDLRHKMTKAFLDHVNAAEDVAELIDKVVMLLYSPNGASAQLSDRLPKLHVPPTRSVTLVLRDMEGVAYTTGTDLDDDHKEIHLSLSYIAHVVSTAKGSATGATPTTSSAVPSATSSAIPFLQPQVTPVPRPSAPVQHVVRKELLGVICHELVHCYQHNAKGTAPGGLIEGIADWVRLRAGYVPPHWKKEAGDDWDAGYQKTGYFLDWLETKYGEGSIPKLNEALREVKYHERDLWQSIFGEDVKHLWKDYCKTLGSS